MQITQEEKVHVAVTKREEPPRAKGTWSFSMHKALYFPPFSLPDTLSGVSGGGGIILVVVFCETKNVKSFMFALVLSIFLWFE